MIDLIGVVSERCVRRTDEGQGLVEYALIILLVAIALVGGLTAFSGALNTSYNFVASGL